LHNLLFLIERVSATENTDDTEKLIINNVNGLNGNWFIGICSPSNIRGGCAFGANIGVFFGWYKFVNAYVEGDKKNFEKMDSCSYPPARLIENLTQIARRVRSW